MKNKINITSKNGTITGIYFDAGIDSDIVIIVNGHNGFYNYGMFPYIQDYLYQNKISSFSFNFSHGGVVEDSDYFEDLIKYEKNCIRLEIEDTLAVVDFISMNYSNDSRKIFLLGHSMGGGVIVLSLGKHKIVQDKIDGIILLNSISELSFWPTEMVEKWKEDKIFNLKNNRTQQLLPQGEEFLNEVLECEIKWNILEYASNLNTKVLVVHGDSDEAIPIKNGEMLANQLSKKSDTTFVIVPNGTHTLNTQHPFVGPSSELDYALNEITNWIIKS